MIVGFLLLVSPRSSLYTFLSSFSLLCFFSIPPSTLSTSASLLLSPHLQVLCLSMSCDDPFLMHSSLPAR